MPTETSYSRLPLRPSRYHDSTLEPLHIDDGGTPDEAYGDKPSPGRSSEAFYWRLFIASCIVALALSALNLTALSAWTTFTTLPPSARPTASEPKRPSPYLGLEKVAVEPSSCRSRATFPGSFYTYDTRAGSNAELTRVHDPGDQATLIFGGPVRLAIHPSLLYLMTLPGTIRSAPSPTYTYRTTASRTARCISGGTRTQRSPRAPST